MNICNMKEISIRFRQNPEQKRCPECGDKLIEMDRRNENGVLFVWHKCGRNNCDGQWLQKTPQESQNSSVSEISQ
jgi:predicted RNA-binding Zn-ribbon protein involved in translation (DUF1610 family)